MNGKKILRISLFFLIALTLAFIWSRSMKSVEESRSESAAVMQFLKPFLKLIFPKRPITNHLVRKLAHFFEYALLGVEIAACYFLWKERKRFWVYPLIMGFTVASIDETIQLFVGRGNQFSDVMLDLFGFACGMGGLCLLIWIVKKGKRENG